MISNFISFVFNYRFYIQPFFKIVAICFYSLILFEFFLEMGMLTFSFTGVISIALMIGYGLRYWSVLTFQDDDLWSLFTNLYADNTDPEAKPIISLPIQVAAVLAAGLLSVSTVFEVTHAIAPFLLLFPYGNLLLFTRFSMVITMFRYILQKNLTNTFPLDWPDDEDLKPNFHAFSSLQFSWMLLLAIFGGHSFLLYTVCHIVSAASLLFYTQKSWPENPIEAVSTSGVMAVLTRTYILVFPTTSLLTWMLAVNTAMLIEEYISTNPWSKKQGIVFYINGLSKFFVTELIHRCEASLVTAANLVHAGTEALYPLLGLRQVVTLTPLSFVISYFFFYVAHCWSMNSKPFAVWSQVHAKPYNDIKSTKPEHLDLYLLIFPVSIFLINFISLPLTLAVLLLPSVAIKYKEVVWEKVSSLSLTDAFKAICSFMHGVSDAHEFEHSQSHEHSKPVHHHHHTVAWISKLIVLLSSYIASMQGCCDIPHTQKKVGFISPPVKYAQPSSQQVIKKPSRPKEKKRHNLKRK